MAVFSLLFDTYLSLPSDFFFHFSHQFLRLPFIFLSVLVKFKNKLAENWSVIRDLNKIIRLIIHLFEESLVASVEDAISPRRISFCVIECSQTDILESWCKIDFTFQIFMSRPFYHALHSQLVLGYQHVIKIILNHFDRDIGICCTHSVVHVAQPNDSVPMLELV